MSDYDFLADQSAQTVTKFDDSVLARVKALLDERADIEARIEKGEEILKSLKARVKAISEIEIPELTVKQGISKLTVQGIGEIRIDPMYKGSVTQDNWNAFCWFLRGTGREDLIKEKLEVVVDTDESKRILSDAGIEFEAKPGIHWKTLDALAKQLFESGEDIPDCFSTYQFYTTKVKA